GSHLGLFSYSTSGEIKFSNRRIFDVGMEMVATYTGRPDGFLEIDATVRNAPFVSTPHDLYRAALPGVFLNPGIKNRQAWVFDQAGARTNADAFPSNLIPLLRDDGLLYGMWLGNKSLTQGLFVIPEVAGIDGLRAPTAHALLQANGQPVLGLNPLDFGA